MPGVVACSEEGVSLAVIIRPVSEAKQTAFPPSIELPLPAGTMESALVEDT